MTVLEQLKEIQKNPIHLIALDMDGTVYNNKKEITPRTAEAIRKAIASGIYVLPASGRPRSGIDPNFLNIENVRYCIYSNGAGVEDVMTGQLIYSCCLEEDILQLLFENLESLNGTFELYCDGKVYASERQRNNWDKWIPNAHIRSYVKKTRIVVPESMRAFYETNKSNIEKVNCSYGNEEEREKALNFLKTIPNIIVTNGLPENVEVNAKMCDKGEALLALANYLNIMTEETMACGDSSNDAAMIAKAGCGVAMGNAEKDIKKLAKIETLTNEEEGVAHLLESVVKFNLWLSEQ